MRTTGPKAGPGRLLACLVLAVLVADAQAVTRALGELIEPWSERLDANLVLDQRLDLGMAVDVARPPDSLDGLRGTLARNGLVLIPLENGDWLIAPGRELSVQLTPLSVEDTALAGPEAEPLADRVASTTVLEDEALVAAADRELDHLFLRAANVFGARDSFYIRGVPRSGDLSTIGNAGVFLDGVPVPAGVLANVPLSTWGASDVRFRRGADAVGSEGPFAAYAGSVELGFGAPDFDPATRVGARVGHLGDYAASLQVDRALVPEQLALRGGLEIQTLAGTLDDSADDIAGFDDARSRTARVAVRWEPVGLGGLSVRGAALWLDGDSGPQTLLQSETVDDPFSRDGGFAPVERNEVRFAALSAQALLDTPDSGRWTLRFGAGDGTVDSTPSRPLANQVLPRFEVIDRTDSRTASLGLEWRRALLPDLRGFGAVSVGDSRLDEQVFRDRARWSVERRLLRQSLALALDWTPRPEVSVMARLRYDRDRLRAGCTVRGEPGAGFAEDRPLTCTRLVGFYAALDDDQRLDPIRETFDSLSPEWTLAWSTSSRDQLFARQYRASNAGGAVSSVTLSGDPFWVVYEPEQSHSAEAGWIRQGGRLSSRLTAFYSTLDKQWSPDLAGSEFPLTNVANDGKSRHYGIEWDGEWQLGERDRLQWSLGWLETRYVNYLPFESDADLVPVAGNEFPGAPRYSGSASWLHRFDSRWSASLALSHHGEAFANANNSELAKVPAATLVDASVTLDLGTARLRAEVRNLFDRDALETTPRLLPNSDLIEYALARPRSVALVFDYLF